MKPGWLSSVAGAIAFGSMVVPVQAATVQITMENLEISPREVSVKVGDTVEWINKDVFAHTATARSGDFDVNLPAKKSGTMVIKKTGMVEYYCRYHPNMKATLKVEP
jgi:plastocyanin